MLLCLSRLAKQRPPTCTEPYCSVHLIENACGLIKKYVIADQLICVASVDGEWYYFDYTFIQRWGCVREAQGKKLSFQACNFTLTPVGTVCLYLNRTATTGQCHLQLPWSRYVSSCLQNRSSLLHGAKVHATIPRSPGQTPHEDTDLKTHIQRRYIITKHQN